MQNKIKESDDIIITNNTDNVIIDHESIYHYETDTIYNKGIMATVIVFIQTNAQMFEFYYDNMEKKDINQLFLDNIVDSEGKFHNDEIFTVMLQLTPDKSENKIIKNIHDNNNNILQKTMGFKSFLACSCDNNNNNEKSESGEVKKHCLKNYIKNEQDFSDENKMEIYHMLHSLPDINNNAKLQYYENKEVSFFSFNQFKKSGLLNNNVPAKIIYDKNDSDVGVEYQLSVSNGDIAVAIENCLKPLLSKLNWIFAYECDYKNNYDDDDDDIDNQKL